MLDLLQGAGTEGFMPHGMCYLWEPDLLWMHVAADTLTWLAYWTIPPFLVYLAWQGRKVVPENAPYATRKLPHAWVFWAFGVFIVACGTTHLMAVWTVWDPAYWLSGGVKVVTAVASVATAVALPPLVPRALDLLREARESEHRRVELEEAHRELEALFAELEQSDRQKTEFFANVSHELRTPLTLILGPLDELLNGADLDPDQRRKLETVRSNAGTLLGHVNDLLDVARLETDSLELDPVRVDAADLVRRMSDHFRELARSRQVELAVRAPGALPAVLDVRKVERILLNLLSNAFKHAPRGGAIRVELRKREGNGPADAETRDRLVLSVADSGPGVPPDERDRIFERFRQAGTPSGSPLGGSGLGLAIVRDFARAMDGLVTVGDAPEGGALFTVVLPAESPGSASRGADADEAPDGLSTVTEAEISRIRSRLNDGGSEPGSLESRGPVDADTALLVVEDDPEMRAYLADTLGVEHRVHLAGDGAAALEMARELRPDLILTDVMLPGMGGEELIGELRSRPELRSIPVLVLTARTEAGLPARLLDRGAQDYVMKPVRTDELEARVRNLLELTRTRRILEEEVEGPGDRLDHLAAAVTRSRRELERTVDEKETLLRELHHRVKGNLQTISSMLRLQLRQVPGDEARTALEDAQGRVAAMAMVHERLYGREQPVSLRLAPYLQKLAATAGRSHSPHPERVEVVVRCDELTLGVDQAVPCGLLVYELLTNALRHAFPGGAGGRVLVTCTEKDGRVTLGVQDDGVGLPDGASREARGMGLDLVEALARQLGGELEMENAEGARFRVVFPLREHES